MTFKSTFAVLMLILIIKTRNQDHNMCEGPQSGPVCVWRHPELGGLGAGDRDPGDEGPRHEPGGRPPRHRGQHRWVSRRNFNDQCTNVRTLIIVFKLNRFLRGYKWCHFVEYFRYKLYFCMSFDKIILCFPWLNNLVILLMLQACTRWWQQRWTRRLLLWTRFSTISLSSTRACRDQIRLNMYLLSETP